MIDHEYQQYPSDPAINLLTNPFWSTDPKYRGNASVAWSKDKWTATLYANYVGPTPNYRSGLVAPGFDEDGNPTGGYNTTGAGKLGSYTIYNASVNYNVTPDVQVSFLVNNLFNRYPDMDLSYPGNSGAPYNGNNYDVYGRSYYVEARWNFGKAE
jgi:outer membrane receptor protein involved in Fe transport